ncbi:NAD(P)/FAD-dependent oxidoreductase [Kribbella sp. NBC_00709]|uniref:FAD-dependent oxidoreductase n=1 Tax=Kribbella sp. NBC_00709 TaxID=2975972 RepID=UPI002E2E0CC5|nr:FAD-dependent oxidoreductase [Kribbella sp. NBC_00709]
MPDRTDLLVVGAGPYAYSAAAFARDNGIETRIVGRPMAFWRNQMPADMFLRSGPDWHLDARGEHTFEAFFEDRGLRPADFDPIPVAVFLEYTDWFRDCKGLDLDERLVTGLTKPNSGFVATLDDGTTITADKVLAAPGVGSFLNLPEWYADVPPARRSHTSDLVSFDSLAGARVVIIGGRQSAYEWAALLTDHGAEHVDVVHRHSTPNFAKVSWHFVDQYVDQTLTHRGWWRGLSPERQRAIASEFWQVGRLTLEPWLVPRIPDTVVTSHPGCAVVGTAVSEHDVTLTLSNGKALTADHVVFASGYRADLARVQYLSGLVDRVSVTEGFPDLTEGLETSLAGLYLTGFAATRDFGPFYGFTKGCPSAAHIAVTDMMGGGGEEVGG